MALQKHKEKFKFVTPMSTGSRPPKLQGSASESILLLIIVR